MIDSSTAKPLVIYLYDRVKKKIDKLEIIEKITNEIKLFLLSEGKKLLFVRSCQVLDIDTPGKDSDKLFQSGLDFAMLITDRHRYLKSRHDLSDYLPIPSEVDWVVQDGEIYPSDIRLVINDEGIISEDGTVFPLDDLSLLINWLRSRDEKQTNSD